MELFLNIAIIVLLGLILITFLRSPKEISKNMAKGCLGMFAGPFINIANAIPKGGNEAPSQQIILIEKIAKADKSNRIILNLEQFDIFLIIKKTKSNESIQTTMSDILKDFPFLVEVTFTNWSKSEVSVIQFNSIDQLYQIMLLTQSLGNIVGDANVFGYMKSEKLSLSFYQGKHHINELIGKTNNEKFFYYSLEDFDFQQDYVIEVEPLELELSLNLSFFDTLIGKQHDESN